MRAGRSTAGEGQRQHSVQIGLTRYSIAYKITKCASHFHKAAHKQNTIQRTRLWQKEADSAAWACRAT